jgi:hypothetical protein
MLFFKILVGLIFNLLGALVFYRGVRLIMRKGLGEGFIEVISGIAFIIIGLLIWLGYIS